MAGNSSTTKTEKILGYLRKGNLPKARTLCTDLARSDPSADTWSLLAAINGRMGILDDAIRFSRKAIAIDPSNAGAHFNLGMALHKQGHLAEAGAEFSRVVQLQSGNADAFCLLGDVYKDLGKLEQAVECYQRSVALNPKKVPSYIGLGAVLIGLGKIPEARMMLNTALTLDPGSKAAKYFLSFIDHDRDDGVMMAQAVSGFFDEFAERFDHHLVEVLHYSFPQEILGLVKSLFGERCHDLDILDAGCGTGLCGIALDEVAHRLVGVDLSESMIEKSRRRNIYDQLIVGDLVSSVENINQDFDLIVAGDVFVYVGDLNEVFSVFSKILRPDGVFVFTTESVVGDSYTLRATGRYAHSLQYIKNLSNLYGLTEQLVKEIVIRHQYFKEIPGHIVALGKQ